MYKSWDRHIERSRERIKHFSAYKLLPALLYKPNLLLFHFQIMVATFKNSKFLDKGGWKERNALEGKLSPKLIKKKTEQEANLPFFFFEKSLSNIHVHE